MVTVCPSPVQVKVLGLMVMLPDEEGLQPAATKLNTAAETANLRKLVWPFQALSL
jgi:hypothetical protein